MKKAAVVFGAIVLAAGIAGFVPALTPEGKLFGIFAVNGAHNIIHIATGVAAILCGMASDLAARRFFQIFGVVYLLTAILGIFHGDRPLLGMVAHNTADMILHFAIAGFSLWMGFARHGALPTHRGPGLAA